MGNVFDEDRRRFRRFASDVKIKFRKLDVSAHQKEQKAVAALIAAKTVNISETGIFIKTSEPVPMNTLLEITIHFESMDREVKTLAKAVWASNEAGNQGIGVEMLKVSPEFFEHVVQRAKRGNWVDMDKG